MCNVINNIRPYLEIAYFLSGVVLSITAIYALKQLRLSKQISSSVSLRDSLKITSEQCKYYLKDIINLQNKLDEFIKQNNISYLKNWIVNITNKSIKISHKGKPNFKELEKIAPYCLEILNAMEAFSTYFTSDLADEKTAFFTVGQTFIYSTELYLPVFSNLNEQNYYLNITKLYLKWKDRAENLKLIKQKDEIEKKLKNAGTTFSLPIGVEYK